MMGEGRWVVRERGIPGVSACCMCSVLVMRKASKM